MKNFFKNLQEKIIKYQELNTPACDKLAHGYWAGKWYAPLGSFISLVLIYILYNLGILGWWFFPIVLIPSTLCYYVGWSKEKRDKTGLGTYDKKDIWATVKPSYTHGVFLIIITSILIYIS